jgi:hypothetical protein
MRKRRGELRAWGYSFSTDQKGCYYPSFLDAREDRIIPSPDTGQPTESFSIEKLKTLKRAYYGRADVLGLRIDYEDEVISVYPRICHHEGANLDKAQCKKEGLICPWHGRLNSALARFSASQDCEIETYDYCFSLKNGFLIISTRFSPSPLPCPDLSV